MENKLKLINTQKNRNSFIKIYKNVRLISLKKIVKINCCKLRLNLYNNRFFLIISFNICLYYFKL